jgi:hypothetical protein
MEGELKVALENSVQVIAPAFGKMKGLLIDKLMDVITKVSKGREKRKKERKRKERRKKEREREKLPLISLIFTITLK